VCTDDHGGVQILLWDLTHPTEGKTSNQDYFFHLHPAREKAGVAVKIRNLLPGSYRVNVYQIGYQQNDPYSRYLELGSPSDLSRDTVSELKRLSSGKPVSEAATVIGESGQFDTTVPLRQNDVCFISLVPQ
jgi:xylan 1,4-beta-xylosidase